MTEPFVLHRGDCLDVLRTMPDNSVDSIVTDPMYGLSKEPDMAEVLRHWLAGDDYKHTGRGFMGKSWDSFVPGPSVWREALRVLKPGGHLLAFFGSRTYDMGTLAIRLAGFEIRDQIQWLYGSGFPKSLDVSKAIDKAAGAQRTEVVGRYQPPGMEKPWNLRNASDERSVEVFASSRNNLDVLAPVTDDARQWEGWGTALKPAHEPIVVARKPLSGTVAANVLAHGTGALNIDGCRVPVDPIDPNHRNPLANDSAEKSMFGIGGTGCLGTGRWPANVIHDGSEEVLAAFPQAPGQLAKAAEGGDRRKDQNCYGAMTRGSNGAEPRDELDKSAARFFYCAKASRAERNAGCDHLPNKNNHPTVKPVALSSYLCRLVTPPGGTVLDLYAGSGSIGVGAVEEGFVYIGIERDEDENGQPLGYLDIANARITHALAKVRAARAADPEPSAQLNMLDLLDDAAA